MKLSPTLRRIGTAAIVVLVAVVVVVLVRRSHPKAALATLSVEAAARRSISLTIEATGTVEPIELVEIKSKASGQIIKMPVDVGSQVKAGDLLAQIDPRDVRNDYNQALAALQASEAKESISKSQKKRSDDLFAQAVLTADEHDAATLDYANASSALVKARTDLDNAKQRLDDATVRAPSAGTIVAQTVTNGQVIASATSSASGGTTLLQMADLTRIRVRALVAESDIGNVKPGQDANVTVDAFPQRPFQGTVEKIEPQAVVQQSVTMFPVLISISNTERLLLPGMNGTVTMVVQEKDDVLAIPVDAVRSARELPAVATALGMNADSVRAQVQRLMAARMAARAAQFASAGGDSAAARGAGLRGGGGGAGGRGAGGGGAGGGMRGGAGRDTSMAARRAAWMARGGAGGGGAPDSAMRRRWMERRAAGGGGTGGGGFGGGAGGGAGRRAGGGGGGAAGGATAGAAGGGGSGGGAAGFGGAGGAAGRADRAQVVLVKTATGLEPRLVRTGLSDFDYIEVVDGLKEGEEVALLSVAEAQAKRLQTQNQVRQRMGNGLPGSTGAGGGGGGRGAGGGR